MKKGIVTALVLGSLAGASLLGDALKEDLVKEVNSVQTVPVFDTASGELTRGQYSQDENLFIYIDSQGNYMSTTTEPRGTFVPIVGEKYLEEYKDRSRAEITREQFLQERDKVER